MPPVIGIVGAYGETGAVVARLLAAQRVAALRLIGRNEGKLAELARGLSGDVATTTADVMNHESLTRACSGCHTVINCAAPAAAIVERVAHAALECGAHYVNPADDAREVAWLGERQAEIEAKRLVFALAAGYVPGLCEMMVRAIYEVHRGRTDAAVKVKLVVIDHNEWSLNGFIDIVEHFCKHAVEIGVYKNGAFARRSMLTAWIRPKMPTQPKPELLMPIRWIEIEKFTATAKPAEVGIYMPIDPALYAVGRFFSIFAPNRLDVAGRLIQGLFSVKAKRQGAGGMLYAEASGRRDRPAERWLLEVPHGRHYERTGEVAALAAALILDGTISTPGTNYLAQAVDPHEFIVRLRVWGVEIIELQAEAGAPA